MARWWLSGAGATLSFVKTLTICREFLTAKEAKRYSYCIEK